MVARSKNIVLGIFISLVFLAGLMSVREVLLSHESLIDVIKIIVLPLIALFLILSFFWRRAPITGNEAALLKMEGFSQDGRFWKANKDGIFYTVRKRKLLFGEEFFIIQGVMSAPSSFLFSSQVVSLIQTHLGSEAAEFMPKLERLNAAAHRTRYYVYIPPFEVSGKTLRMQVPSGSFQETFATAHTIMRRIDALAKDASSKKSKRFSVADWAIFGTGSILFVQLFIFTYLYQQQESFLPYFVESIPLLGFIAGILLIMFGIFKRRYGA